MGNFNLTDYEAGKETPEEKGKWQKEARWLRQSETSDNHSGYIPFNEVVSEVGKSERQVRYDVATSSYAHLIFGKQQDSQVLYPQEIVELVAKTGICPQCIGKIPTVSVSEEGRIMRVSGKTVLNDIKSQRISGWCSEGHWVVDMQNGLDQASLHKPVNSTPLYRGTLELSKEIRRLMATSHY
jgi:hypothetical protein